MRKFLFPLICLLLVISSCRREELTVKKVTGTKCSDCKIVLTADTTTVPMPEKFKNLKTPPEYIYEYTNTLCEDCIEKRKIEAVFDVPTLIKMSVSKIKSKLGKPLKGQYIPTPTQWKLPGMTGTIEYQIGTTNIQVDYSKSGKIVSIFISDSKPGRTASEIKQLANLTPPYKGFSIRIQKWLNPAKAKGKARIAGIEVKAHK